ncbi:protein GRINL1A [Bufo gargarizans]|uniref:protein GRINL1A n=1 Tax=Bufo gargarizans TaxID=30331 RepID=UPI001CF1591C|nr:protein GRINL1A [Bufo gargarizans]
MSGPVDRGQQGPAGELRGKTLGELTEILERQEKLLSNKKFIAKLPDRGKKISDYAEKVRTSIAELNRRQNAIDLLSAFKSQFQEHECNIRKNAEISEDQGTHVSSNVGEGEETTSIPAHGKSLGFAHELETSSSPMKITEETCCDDSRTDENSADALANSLKVISIQESGAKARNGPSETTVDEKTRSSPGTSGAKKSHYIDVIEKRSMSPVRRKEKFRTNRLPSDSNCSTPNQSPGDKVLIMSPEERKLHDRKHLDDITAARLPPLHHSPAQLLPLEESLALQMAQKVTYEEKQAKYAAQKLFEKLNIKMGPFNPEGDSYMKYRDPRADE